MILFLQDTQQNNYNHEIQMKLEKDVEIIELGIQIKNFKNDLKERELAD